MTAGNREYWEEKWAKQFSEDGLVPSTLVVKMYERLKDKPIKTVLDLGAGKGRDSFWLAARGYRVTALDISPSALQYIKDTCPNIQTICSDIADFDGGAAGYDWVLANLSLHYWDDAVTRMIVKQIYRTLNPGGWLSIRCKSVNDPECGQGVKIGDNIYYHGHMRHFFTPQYMKELLQCFEVVCLEECMIEEKHYGRYTAVEALAVKTDKKDFF